MKKRKRKKKKRGRKSCEFNRGEGEKLMMAIMHVRIIIFDTLLESNDLTINAEILIICIRVPKSKRNL